MNGRTYQFDWDEFKAVSHERKHEISFELASSIFHDPHLLTVADLAHSATEERWFSVGAARNGAILSVAYLWSEADPEVIQIRLISARRATQSERRQYEEDL